MDEDWRAALEYLKRRHPERWQDRSKVNVSGSMKLDLSKLSNDELTELKALIGKAQPK
jgi:hypothetical protein